MKIKRVCKTCKKIFFTWSAEIRKGGGKYCSRKCYLLRPNNKIKRICLICKNIFFVFPHSIKKGFGKFCTRRCKSLAMIGNKASEKTKQKMSKRRRLSNNPNWKGGRMKISRGYILIKTPTHPFRYKSNYVLEHRLVMERFLGRYLLSKEIVHHINKTPGDNRIENLRLFANNGKHIKFHQLFK